jgi:hypothetical protein
LHFIEKLANVVLSILENIMAERMQKDQAHKLVDKMPDDSTWDDLINEIYVREVIDQGLEDSRKGRTIDVSDVRKRYGLAQ